ncbi:carboxypeptidase-like regulatory domain-containing protein, partial [Acidobacteriota bacterium]
MNRIIRIGLCITALFLAVGAQATGLGNLVKGTILDDKDRALPDVKVAFYSLEKKGKSVTTFTDQDGVYLTLGIPEGRYRVVAARKGYVPAVKEMIDVSPQSIKALNFRLTPIDLLKEPKNRSKAPWILRTLNRDILRHNGDEAVVLADGRDGSEHPNKHLGDRLGGNVIIQTTISGGGLDEPGLMARRGADRYGLALGLSSPNLDWAVQASRYSSDEETPETRRSLDSKSLRYELQIDGIKDHQVGVEGEIFGSNLKNLPVEAREQFSSLVLSWERQTQQDVNLGVKVGYLGSRLSLAENPAWPEPMDGMGPIRGSLPEGTDIQNGSIMFFQGEMSRVLEGLGFIKAEAEILSSNGDPLADSLYIRSIAPEKIMAVSGLNAMAPWSVLLKGELNLDFFEPLMISPGMNLYHAPETGDNLIFIPQIDLTYLPDNRTEMKATVLYNGIAPFSRDGEPVDTFLALVPASTLPPAMGYGLAVRRDLGNIGDLGVMVKFNETYVPGIETPAFDRSLQGKDFIVLRSGGARSTEYGVELRSDFLPGVSGALSSHFGKAAGRVEIIPFESAMAEPLRKPADESESRFFMARMRTSIDWTDTSVGFVYKWADQVALAQDADGADGAEPTELTLVDLSITQGESASEVSDLDPQI